MPQPHILAVETYGKERIRGRASGAMLSAYKLGYSTAAHAVLQALYGAKAVDVTPPRATYRYLSITVPTRTAKGFLLLALTDDEQAQAESITRKHSGLRSGCWRWHDNAWQAYPTQHDADYQTAVGAPRFNPSSYNPVSPSHAAVPQNTSGIQVERTQHDDNQPPWWWITGDTYPHRVVFKAAGCRWSKKRRAWYYIGDKLPASVQALVSPSDDNPEPPPVAPAMPDDDEPDCSDAPYAVGGKVRAAKTFDGLNPDTSKPVTIPADTHGTITSCEGSVSSLGYAFHVDFEGLGVVWCFERDLVPDESDTPPAVEVIPDEDEPASVRVIQPEVLSDEWQAAIKSGANVSLQPIKRASQHR